MSTTVKDIVDAFESDISTNVLGSEWSELLYKFDIEQNNFRSNDQRYAVIPGFGQSFSGILKNYTVAHDFQCILVRSFINRDGDAALRTALYDIYDKFDDIYKRLLSYKLGIPSVVLHVESFTIEEPEILDENNVVAVRSTFTIQYRKQLV